MDVIRLLGFGLLLCGCTAVATTPSWVGGGLAVTGPRRAAAAQASEEREREKRVSQPSEIAARHILVMHVGSRARPASITRSREQARARAAECLGRLRAGADFGELVAQYSDEPGAAARGGDLGDFGRDVMVAAFSDAAFALRVGEVSEVVETPYGFHVIKRTR
ncbi:MAG: peptidyl-prolyl cis-trans isomerase [Deltaproteobacteria bacterium]|nr:peptidyl-prolyl cis-trans isomerase [Deltaproteobacteria bacterium]